MTQKNVAVKALETLRQRGTPAQVARFEALVRQAHAEAAQVLRTGEGTITHPELALMQTTLGRDLLPAARGRVGNDGTLYGFQPFEQLDPGWVTAGAAWATEGLDLANFANDPAVIAIPNTATLGIAGDWGTGYYRPSGTPAQGVAEAMASYEPTVTIHLGDEYYAGSPDEEQDNLVALWPQGSQASLALNSNHSMYYGARGYFGTTLASPVFAAQQGTSFFALVNDDWVIFGLDTAYNATWSSMFMDGALGSLQQGFIARTLLQYPNRKVMVLTHHTGTTAIDSTTTSSIWAEVKAAIGKSPDYWYWGHAHNAVVYGPIDGCLARCNGHGAIPYGQASSLEPLLGSSVVWYEDTLAGDPTEADRCLNGAVIVDLNGASITETFVGEDGSVRWSSVS